MIKAQRFANQLVDWYRKHPRPMPWKGSNDPYVVWISEVILQQTRVNQATPYFEKFIKKFPDLRSLAEAPLDDVLTAWQGLGYYTRARNLHETANYLWYECGGNFPREYHQWLRLKGIGPYTAAAITSFCFKEKIAVIDGNVERIMARLYLIDKDLARGSGKKEVRQKADITDVKVDPAEYNQAIMNLGAMICTPRKPKCEECPANQICEAYAHNMQHSVPIPKRKVSKQRRFMHCFLYRSKDHIYIVKRPHGDIWSLMYELPTRESVTEVNLAEKGHAKISLIASKKHILSHQKLQINFYKVGNAEILKQANGEPFSVPISELHKYAFPRPISWFFERIRLL